MSFLLQDFGNSMQTLGMQKLFAFFVRPRYAHWEISFTCVTV
jgi:hypothetical protein